MLVSLNLLAFALCVVFLAYVAVICISYLRLAPPPPGEVDTFGWHVVVPCLDEEAVIGTTLHRLLAAVPTAHLWCVDDASSDRTAAIVAEIAAEDPRVHLLRRTLPDARQGKGEALNHAWRAISAWEAGTRDRSRVIVGVVDADGELDAGALPTLASDRYFGDPTIGAVQVAVRIANRSTGERPAPRTPWRRRLLDLQDLEFVGPIAAMQLLRERTGSVAMGGNGQLSRLSVLDEIAERAGTPWHGALLEDFELGVHVLLAGHRTAYCHHVQVAQEGLPTVGALIRQRSRWAQGAMQCRRYLRPVLASRHIPNAAAFEIAYFLLLPWIQVVGSIVYAASYLVLFGYLAGTAGGPAGWIASGQWGVLPLVAVGGLGPFVIWGVIYRARVEPSLTRRQAVALGVANWLYSALHHVAIWWAVGRVLTRRRDWKKTARLAAPAPSPAPQPTPIP
ncbi:MAG TPA: glycosyltransferase family 2 protein [Iamia sp.]|nr:glycosyltransferase family 2 protein [Iamia sp.]